jgi:hypothetical protein
MNSIILMSVGAVCVVLSIVGMRALTPREGKPPSAWVRTEGRATAASLTVFILLIGGAALLLKGVFS